MDVAALWDFDDPAASEARFRSLAAVATTQAARALGLQERYADGHDLLDAIDSDDAEVVVRVALERGRLHRSAGDPDAAAPLFAEAAAAAAAAGLEALHVDALHMVALVADPTDRLARHEEALAVARAATDPAARDWDASLLHNVGMTHADAEDWPAALAAFDEALAARERIGDPGRTRVARWMVAWTLRHLGRADEALAIQRALKAELESVGEHDPYVDEELAVLERRDSP